MTHDQHIASDPAISAWVSASAGTGKTKVLTDRVLRLLLAGANPTKILCITYTRAAAAEMESRIGAQLAHWAVTDEENLRVSLHALTGKPAGAKTLTAARRLFAQVLDAPERIRIQTIHSLCQSILARFPLEAGVPPHFTLIDDLTARELLAQMQTWLFANSGKPENYACADAISELAAHMSEPSLHKLIKEVVADRRKFEEWLAASPDAMRIYGALGLAADMDEERLLKKHLRYTPEEEQELRQACAALAEGGGKSDRQTYDALRVWLETREDVDAYGCAYITQKGTPRAQLYTKGTAQRWPQLEPVLLAEQRRMLAYAEECRSLFIARMSLHVSVLAAAMLDLYHRAKERHAYLDYDDLILYTVRLLEKPGIAPWVLYKLDGGIDHLLIDEAQDTAPEQWRIAGALAGEFFAGEGARNVKRTLFVVGDEKQSIFSFQGAEPLAFDAMQRRLSKLATDAGADFRRVQLALSFRSTEAVLAAVDSVFAQPQARDGLLFTEADIRHEVHRTGQAGRVELWPLMEVPEEETLPAWHIPDAASFAARPDLHCAEHIADTVAGWLKEQRQLVSQGRAVRPGDIMILVQRRGVFADALLRALKRRDVPVAGADRLVLTEHIAVEDCMALARFLLLPQDDLTLAEVLRSPLVGLSEEALFELAYERGKKTLWHRLRDNPAYAHAHDFLSGLLAVTDYMPPYELFAHMLEACGGRRKLASRLGPEIDDPLNEFLALALHYGNTRPPSLQGFLHWLEAGEIQIKRDMEKGRDEVRILTVHGAKGLQAPIVFLPDTVRTPMHDGGILWTKEGIPLFTSVADSADKHFRALKDMLRTETEREYRRLLYVAMTRAEDELIICGWKGHKAISGDCWYELIRHAAEAWETEGDKRALVSLQSVAAKAPPSFAPESFREDLPGWVSVPTPDEPKPTRPLTPSQLQPVADAPSPFATAARARGILVHRLLQYLPDIAPEEREQGMERFMARHDTDLTPDERGRIGAEVLGLLTHPEFAPVFGPDSVAEASIAGVAPAGVIAGRIDRLAVLPDAVYIIDYKTGRVIPENEAQVPEAYIRQMEAYRQLVSGIYPDKTIYCGLLWTAGPKLLVLSDARLRSLAA